MSQAKAYPYAVVINDSNPICLKCCYAKAFYYPSSKTVVACCTNQNGTGTPDCPVYACVPGEEPPLTHRNNSLLDVCPRTLTTTVKWLALYMSEYGPIIPIGVIRVAAAERGISWNRLRRAKRILNLASARHTIMTEYIPEHFAKLPVWHWETPSAPPVEDDTENSSQPGRPSMTSAACEWLKEKMEKVGGRAPAAEIRNAWKETHFSYPILQRAKSILGIKSEAEHDEHGNFVAWYWVSPS